jgi:ABC-type transporter Mla subunit MlaD
MTNGQRRSEAAPGTSEVRALRVLYFGTFTAAALGSFALSALGLWWLPALWGVSWMLGYLLLARNRAPGRLRTEEFGDNYYYFGFLLTLVSLCGVLVQLGLSDAGMSDNLLRVVLSQFGLALITTILGLAVRTVLLMNRPTPEDMEQRAQEQMTRAFDTFVHSLNRLSAEADAFSQGFGEKLRTIMTNVEVAVGNFGEVVRSTTADVAPLQSQLEAASSTLRDSSGTIRHATGHLVGELQSSARTLRGAFGDLGTQASQAVQELSRAASRLRETVEIAEGGVREPLASLETRVSNFAREVDRIAGSLGRFPAELAGAAASAGKSLGPLSAEVDGLTQTVGQIQSALRSIASGIEGEGASIDTSVRSLQVQIGKLADIHARLAEESQGTSSALVQVRREMAAAVNFLINQMQRGDDTDRPVEG